ncbi:MAG: hypothetical protein AAF539_00575 [Planctomycetota bacterium]
MKFRLPFAFGAVILLAFIATPSMAQVAALSEIYGRGVHSYFSGRHQESHSLLSDAISNGLQDPRAHYFRGFAAIKMGRSYEADGDFQVGADLEARTGFAPVVGRALIRIQGAARLQLEQVRAQARIRAVAEGQARSNQRRRELGAMPPKASDPATMPRRSAVPPPPPSTDNPFADDRQPPIVESPDALEGAMDDPLAGDAPLPESNAAPAGSDPFNSPAPAEDPFAAPADDPFAAPGNDGGAMEDPFGADPFGNSDPFSQ